MAQTAAGAAPAPTAATARGFLEARRVALIGASGGTRDRWSYNARMTRSLLASPFDQVVLVSRNDREIGGHPAYATLAEHPGPAGDVCVLVVPRAGLPDAVRDAAAAGWPRLVVITGQLTSAERTALREASPVTRVWGPNCTGYQVSASGLRVMASDYEPGVRPGRPRVAVVGQSGGALNAIGRTVEDLGLNVSHLLSTGEEIDVGVEDVLSYLAWSGGTDAVVVFLEEARRPGPFLGAIAACQAASIPIAVVKVGRSRPGQAAAATHTGALVGDWDEFEAAVHGRGAVVCESLRDGAGVAALSGLLRRRVGARTAFFTSSGGTGVLACDLAESSGLTLAELSPTGAGRLRELAGGGPGPVNPYDSANGGGTPSTLPTVLATLAGEPGVDTVVVLHSGDVYGDFVVDHLTGDPAPGKPVVTVWPAVAPGLRDRLIDAGIPVVNDVADACRWLALAAGCAIRPVPPPAPTGPAGDAGEGEGPGWLPYGEAVALLERGGVDVPRRMLVQDGSGAAAFAGRYPVVVKAAGLRGHKARLGGVARDVTTPDQLTDAVRRLRDRFGPVVIEEQVARGIEVVLAVRTGPFGGVLVVGFGGAHADVLGRQVVLRPDTPVSEVRDRVAASLVGALLSSDLGEEPGRRAVDSLAAMAVRLSAIVAAERLDSIEVNPVMVTTDRVVACDVKARSRS